MIGDIFGGRLSIAGLVSRVHRLIGVCGVTSWDIPADDKEKEPDLIMIPAHIAEKAEAYYARQRLKEARRAPRNHHGSKPVNRDKPFLGWDGEGPRDAGYALFGNSEGMEICYPFLKTKDCLELILDTESKYPDAIHIGFGFNYDVSNILRELPVRHLSALKHWAETEYKGYQLQHIPNKWFQVKYGNTVARIFDIRSFFGTNYVGALLALGIGSDDEIAHLTSEKARRSEFLWSEIQDIREYYHLELALLPRLGDKLRSTFLDAGFDVRSWHGPGALANMAMRRHRVPDAKAVTPAAVQAAAQCAFAGGRFEMPRGGFIERKCYCADKRSAYPAFARLLPNLARGTWRTGRDFESNKFALYRIRYRAKPDPLRVYPLFRRLQGGEVVWSHETEGWYWGPEAELVKDDPDAVFLESLIFDEDDPADRPFKWLEEYYNRRQFLKKQGSILELTFKLVINSVYGQLAQRTGWDKRARTAPKSHQLEWAGFITSACRAAIYNVAHSAGDRLVSIDTDGVTSLAPFDSGLDVGPDLGQWELDEYDAGIFWQSGIYALKRGGEWIKGRTRGIPKGTYSADQLIEAMQTGTSLRMRKKTFVGYGLALNGRLDEMNTWKEDDIEIVFGGEGKRYHNNVLWCAKRGCRDGIHDFISRPVRFSPADSVVSVPHSLPWLGADQLSESRRNTVQDLILYDANDLQTDEEWVLEYA